MPRKLYKNIEDSPALEVPPGAGEPQSAKEKALSKIKRKHPTTSGVEDAQTRFDAIEQDLAGMGVTSLADKMNDPEWLKADAALRHAKRASRVETGKRGKAKYHENKEIDKELDYLEAGLNQPTAKEIAAKQKKSAERREPRTAEQEEMAYAMSGGLDRDREVASLEGEKADNLRMMKDMGGVWGGEKYFILSERNEEIDAKLNKLRGRAPGKATESVEELTPATEDALVMGELTPEDRVADARKAIDFMNAYEQEIAARQKAVRAELKKLGIKDAAQIDAEMEVISPELRQKAIGLDPGLWYKMKRMGRNLMGMERPPEIKGLLEKYAQLENEMNEQLHKRREAEAELMAAHAVAGTTPMRRLVSSAQMRSMERRANVGNPDNEGVGLDLSAVGELFPKTAGQLHVEQELESLGHIEQGSLQKELAAVRALRTLEEELQDSMLNFAGRKESLEPEDVKLYKEKLEDLHTRLRSLDESAGKSPEAIEALQNVEGAYAQYRRMVNQALAEYDRSQAAAREAFQESLKSADEQSKREREAGRAQPMSVIGRREGEYGSYGASKQGRRTVNLGKAETSDTYERRKTQEQREAEELREKVNKEVQNYRSIKWRKELIDSINQNEQVRAAMHSMYDAFKARAIALQNEGVDLGPLQTSPDPALDYSLNMYRLHARKDNGEPVYGDQLRDAAANALVEAEEALGSEWNGSIFDRRIQQAMDNKRPETKVEEDEYEEIEIPDFVGSQELYAKLPADLKEDPEALNFAYRLLNRDEVGSYSREFAVRQITKRMVTPDKSKAERLYDALRPEEEAAPIPLTRVKRARSEDEIQKEEELDIPITVELPEEEQVVAAAPDKPKKKRQMQSDKFGFQGASNAEPEIEKRPIRSKSGWSPETKQAEREKPYGPLSQEELAYLKESLNRIVLSKGDEWLTLGPKVKSHFGKGDWIEQYANQYAAYRGGKLDKKNAELTRRDLEAVNALLGIKQPSDLTVAPSPELREEVSQAWQQADEESSRRRKAQKKSSQQKQGQKSAGEIIEYERFQQAQALKQKKKKGA